MKIKSNLVMLGLSVIYALSFVLHTEAGETQIRVDHKIKYLQAALGEFAGIKENNSSAIENAKKYATAISRDANDPLRVGMLALISAQVEVAQSVSVAQSVPEAKAAAAYSKEAWYKKWIDYITSSKVYDPKNHSIVIMMSSTFDALYGADLYVSTDDDFASIISKIQKFDDFNNPSAGKRRNLYTNNDHKPITTLKEFADAVMNKKHLVSSPVPQNPPKK